MSFLSVQAFNFPVLRSQLSSDEIADLKTLQLVSLEWAKIASERFTKTHGAQFSAAPLCDEETLILLKDSRGAIHAIRKMINHFLEGVIQPCWCKALVCQDTASKVQAIALLDSKNRVLYIASHPNNIRSPLSDQTQRIHGAATQIFLHLAKNALKTGEAIQLESSSSAENFYKNLGFVPIKDSPDIILTADKIALLVSQKIHPFDKLEL